MAKLRGASAGGVEGGYTGTIVGERLEKWLEKPLDVASKALEAKLRQKFKLKTTVNLKPLVKPLSTVVGGWKGAREGWDAAAALPPCTVEHVPGAEPRRPDEVSPASVEPKPEPKPQAPQATPVPPAQARLALQRAQKANAIARQFFGEIERSIGSVSVDPSVYANRMCIPMRAVIADMYSAIQLGDPLAFILKVDGNLLHWVQCMLTHREPPYFIAPKYFESEPRYGSVGIMCGG